jgi:hypothetical protein
LNYVFMIVDRGLVTGDASTVDQSDMRGLGTA